MFAGIHAGTAANAPVNIIVLLVYAHDAKVIEVGLNTVIGTSGHCHLDVVMGRKYDLLNFPGQLVCIDISLDAVGVSNTGHHVPGSDGGIAVIINLHVHIAHLHIHIMDIAFEKLVHCFDVLVFDPRHIQGLPGTHMKCSVAVALTKFLHHGQVPCLYHGSGHTHLKHKLSCHLGLPETVDPHLFNIYIVIHSLPPLS